MERQERNTAIMTVPQFGGWDHTAPGATDYSMVFSQARANKKYRKTQGVLVKANQGQVHHAHVHANEDVVVVITISANIFNIYLRKGAIFPMQILSSSIQIQASRSLGLNSPHSVSSALNRISVWRSRGSLPVLIELAASIIQIHLKDPYFMHDLSNDASLSDEIFATLYCMAIMRSSSFRSKKQLARILKSVLQIYSSFSLEIVLLEYLLKAVTSSEFKENADDVFVGLTTQNVLDDWKLVIRKLCNKEPEILLNLLKEVLAMIETHKDMKYRKDNPRIGISHTKAEFQRSDYLSLFSWLIGILSKVPSAAANMPRRILLELLHKCLLISQFYNKQLMDSAIHLAELMDDRYLLEKVQKLSLIGLSNFDKANDQSFLMTPKSISQFEECILKAAKKL
ncbi:hypothetical protein RJT34_11096 [Clitoria ternatea]|uniref:RIN4 pathogenic type III effector avirulence factor Avr cleavage site domain-containing protein n=1 Tax=Clitoria ternatea TaxID=43366 RepID=A0AAN9JJA4_CLITE